MNTHVTTSGAGDGIDLSIGEKKALLEEVHQEFVRAVHEADGTKSGRSGMSVDNVQALDDIDFWINNMLPGSPDWDRTRDYLAFLSSALDSGEIVLSREDVPALDTAIVSLPYEFLEQVKPYVPTGEFLDVARLWSHAHSLKTSDGLLLSDSSMRIRMRRLFDFDSAHSLVAATKNKKTDTEDSENMSAGHLPLEMRVHLSGFFEEVTDEELYQEGIRTRR